MDRFSRFNPKATLLFFVLQIFLTIFIFNPYILSISFLSGCVYKAVLEGKKGVSYIFRLALPLIIIVMLFNFIFTHYGNTPLFVLFDMNFTIQSLFYGFVQGLMLSSVLLWFSLYSVVITSERFLAVFGRLAPDLALLFSMVLSFIPRLRKNAEEIHDARMLVDVDKGKLEKSIDNFSALVTLTLEQSMETADSMRARGFGKKRTVYSKYRFSIRDAFMLIFELLSFAVVIVFKLKGSFVFTFEPDIISSKINPFSLIIFALLSFLPVITDALEDMKWHYLKQKI